MIDKAIVDVDYSDCSKDNKLKLIDWGKISIYDNEKELLNNIKSFRIECKAGEPCN